MSSILADRELGTIPISIATALAIDGLYNRHPDLKPVKPVPASKASVVYINLRTLFRNVHGAVGDRQKANSVSPKDYANVILDEISEIRIQLSQEEIPLGLVVYLPTYKSIAYFAGKGYLRPLNTDNQKTFNNLENAVLTDIHNRYKVSPQSNEDLDKPYIDVDMEIDVKDHRNIFIITHLPIDLLNIKNVSDVLLLESHTGRVKSKELWYTKLATGKDSRIPFNKGTMLFFGDSGGLFKPQPIKARNTLIEIAKSKKWNAFTTPSRILLGIETSQQPFLLKTMRELIR